MITPLTQVHTLPGTHFRHPLADLAQTNFVAREIVQDYPEVTTAAQFRALDLSHMQCMAIGQTPLFVQMDEVEHHLS